MSDSILIPLALTTVLAPLLAFVLIVIAALRNSLLAKIIAISGATISMACATVLLSAVDSPNFRVQSTWMWLLEDTSSFTIGVLLDPLSLVMLWTVAIIAWLVQIYSLSYMADDPRQGKFYAFIALFCFAMMGFTIAPNLLQSFMCWELVGLGSYLLIGFWNHLPSAAQAARKAFIVTRLGDLGFFAALLLAWTGLGTLDFGELSGVDAASSWLRMVGGADYAMWISVALFLAIAGKSAQFPLSGWLPDAMEGPTPVSALIHAATMVAAGVYLLARMSFILALGSESANLAWYAFALIAILSALMSGAVAIVQSDIKRVMAYSTISQLGYMIAAIATGAVTAGMMHLFTHAFFKALLFLTAGAFIHAAHTNSITEIARAGGAKLKGAMIALFAGSLALIGMFPFAGFYSKDAILEHWIVHHDWFMAAIALLGVLITAYYTSRVIFLLLKVPEETNHHHELHLGRWMKFPLGFLTVASLVAGNIWLWKSSQWFVSEGAVHGSSVLITITLSTLAALTGVFYSARVFYWRNTTDPIAQLTTLATVLREKWYLDRAYEIVVHKCYMPATALLQKVETVVMKGSLDAIGSISVALARTFSRLQTGDVQDYLGVSFMVVAGVVLILMSM